LEEAIVVRGAREHNLRNIDVRIPKRSITVVTGVSGSGKSTLAFDVIYSEGQRRYVECVSAYAKQFLERISRPAVESIEGLCPALAIRASGGARSARSTVGTSTEIYDYLRLLFARIGIVHCLECGEPVAAEAAGDLARRIVESGTGSVALAFPARVGDASLSSVAQALVSQGFLRAFNKGEVLSLEDTAPEDLLFGEDEILVVADRVKVKPGIERRLVDSIELALSNGGGTVYVIEEGREPARYSRNLVCDKCNRECTPPSPLLFSFNSPAGACPKCRGFGDTLEFSLDLIVPDKRKTLREGAVAPWWGEWRPYFLGKLRDLEKRGLLRLDVPFYKLRGSEKEIVLRGCSGFTGVLTMLEKFKRKTYKKSLRFIVKKYQAPVRCTECRGTRLRKEALCVSVGGKTIAEVASMTIEEALHWLEALELSPMKRSIADRVLREAASRLSTLLSLGAGYLTLDRLTRSLSAGEEQRIELAGALGARLAETLYVLDEPTVGLHPRDTERLIRALRELKEAGNTVLVVEHDRDVIAAADWVVDLGPGAGREGGAVVFEGSPGALARCGDSATGRYLAERAAPGLAAEPAAGWKPGPRRAVGGRGARRAIRVKGARAHNLKSIDVEIPLGRMVAVTGVSGAGKSSLVEDVLFRECSRALGRQTPAETECDGVEGLEHLDDVVLVDRSPIGKSPRSNAVTYLKAFDGIRRAFASTPQARARGFDAGTFSFNRPGGRCEACAGEGSVKVEMYFMADLYLDCEECGGGRYKPEVLEVEYRGRNIREVLDSTVDEALELFSDRAEIAERLWLLQRVGLGYLRLGQPAPTLSGGEAQRVKIARELLRARGERVLYILDEPTIGLHFADIERLLSVLRELVKRGHAVLMVEHNLDVIARCDWVVDLGPGAGDLEGGRLVAQGTPADVARCAESVTGRFLASVLQGSEDAVLERSV